ncbi:MAG: type II secretion system protein [Sulfurospirillum sp.]
MRKAVSMLELVIAIVVMGIAMMTLPTMLTTIQNNNIFSLRQEAILAARTQLGDELTYLWDENSIDSSSQVVAVLDTNSSYFKRNPTNGTRRIGHIKGNKRRKFFTSPTYATSPANLGKDGSETTPNDIDDFSSSTPITIQHIANTLDYRYDLNMTTAVSYVDDNFTQGITFDFSTNPISPAKSTSIKMTTLTITNDNDFNMILRAYSCNIGANQLLRRDF